jgi:hypothetical protein
MKMMITKNISCRFIRGCVIPSSRFLFGMPRIIISSFGFLFLVLEFHFNNLEFGLDLPSTFSNYLLFLHLPPSFPL